jgi:PKD repeat protein
MKKTVLLLVAIMASVIIYAQAVQRNKVILEVATATWCTYCPAAAIAADSLVNAGKQVAVIEYHNTDAFSNAYGDARNNYNGVTGYPTANFDGPTNVIGGYACPGLGLYPTYLNNYNTCYAVQSPLTIDISGTNSGNTYNLVISVYKLATITGSDLRLQLALTESNIATAPWPSAGCMHQVNYVERLMAPDANGTSFNFSSGNMQIINLSFTKDASWVTSNCEVVAFVQDYSSKTIYNGAEIALNSIPVPVSVNFTSNVTTGCAPVTVNYTDQSTGVNTYQWNLPGGTPSSPTVPNPSVVYNTTGTFDATLTAWNSANYRGNIMVKTSYINISALPGTPGTPIGTSQLCQNPPDQTYTASPASNATTYTWDLQPSSAGVITPAGNSCTVNFDNTYTGTALLKVKGSNTCGDGPWSPTLSITVSLQPSTAGTPTGPYLLCLNPPNTDYQTSGASPVTSYVWQITPTTAGTISGTSTTGTVDWASTYTGTAQITVAGINNGCQGPWSASLNVTVNNLPNVFTMTGGGATCATGGTGVPVGLEGSETGTNYTLYLDGSATTIVVPGTGGAISFGNQFTGGNYSAQALNPSTTCSNPMNGTVVVTIDPQVPDAPAEPTGNGAPTGGSTTQYTTTGGTYASTYNWAVTPSNAGVFTGDGPTGSITWSNTYLGSASIKVQGINSCGAGSYSIEFPVNVETGIGETKMQKLVTISPNPATESVRISPLYKMKSDLKVFNSLGCLVIEKNNIDLSSSYQLDISRLVPGIYYFKILTDDAQQIQKVIVE